MKKLLIGLSVLSLAGLVLAVTLPVTGSFFSSTVVGGTNCFTLPSGVSTNLPSTNYNSINVSGAGTVAIMVDLAGVTATTQAVRAVFSTSLDGVLYTTATNGLYIDIPTAGATRVTWTTNIPAATISPYAYMRLSILAQTNLGNVFFSNITYRFLQASQ